MAESTRVRTVLDRSAAEMPVVTPSLASTLTVKAVLIRSLFCEVISGSWSRSSSSPSIGTQITPLVCLIVNARSAGVALLAAKMMSPSFSRSASSTTTTARPAAMSAIARSTRVQHDAAHLLRCRVAGGPARAETRHRCSPPASSRSTYLAMTSTSMLT